LVERRGKMPGFGRRFVVKRNSGPRVRRCRARPDQSLLAGSILRDPNDGRIAPIGARANHRRGGVGGKRQQRRQQKSNCPLVHSGIQCNRVAHALVHAVSRLNSTQIQNVHTSVNAARLFARHRVIEPLSSTSARSETYASVRIVPPQLSNMVETPAPNRPHIRVRECRPAPGYSA